jgi:hypothetical protein
MITETTPTKSEFDKAFFCLFEDGDYTAIANAMGHSPEYVSQLYSPTGDRKSNLYRAFRDLRALRERCAERGDKALALFVEFVTRGLDEGSLSVIEESLKLKREVDEWETSSMQQAPESQIVKELHDISIQADRTLEAYASKKIRTFATEAVKDRRNGSK